MPSTLLKPLLAFLLALATLAAAAKDAPPAAADPALEARLWAIAIELRCLVCQNQTIADSNADLAVDLRNQVREMLEQGRSEREIIDYMTARYGDFVLYRPPMRGATMLLWFGPVVFMAGGLVVLWLVLRRRSRMAAEHFEPDETDETDETDEPGDPDRAGLPAAGSAARPPATPSR